MRLQSSLRQMLTGGVAIQKTNPTDPNETQKYDFIGSLGISVDRYGKASIDETKLKEVITKEPDRVAGFFSRSITVDGTTEKEKSRFGGKTADCSKQLRRFQRRHDHRQK